tara:strand:- start:2305 stop:2886 length:582 start_codon:yes stop_codon:yes gene_type:complete
MIKELLLSSVLSYSISVRTPNDATQPLDYELMAKIEKTDGDFTYLLKRDWEREHGEEYLDFVGKFKFKSPNNMYGGIDVVDKNSKDIHYGLYNVGFYSEDGWSLGISAKDDTEEGESTALASIGFAKKAKQDKFEYLIDISAKSDLSDNQIFNIKSELKKWFNDNINIFALYKHEYYNEKEDFQFKVGIGLKF